MANRGTLVQCAACGAYERVGTRRCFSCGTSLIDDDQVDVGDAVPGPAYGSVGSVGSGNPGDGGLAPAPTEVQGFGRGAVAGGPAGGEATIGPPAGTGPPGPYPMPGTWGGPAANAPGAPGTPAYGHPTPGAPGSGYPGTGYGNPYGYDQAPGSALPGYGPMGYGYGGLPPQQEKGATTSLVLGIVAFVFCGFLLGPAALWEGAKARRRIRESGGRLTGDTMALAGMILGGIAFVLNIAVFAFYLWAASQPRYRF